MKIRTVYFKVPNMDKAITFWKAFLGTAPHKHSQKWSEFKCQNINLGLLFMEGHESWPDSCGFVPVFEFSAEALETQKNIAQNGGARVVIDIQDHPDGMSYVMADPFGNEFEITRFRD